MLIREELSLIRAALAYWSEEIMLHPLPSDTATQQARLSYESMTPRALELLYHRLAEHSINYIVVDSVLNHMVNTRLFKFPPRLQPAEMGRGSQEAIRESTTASRAEFRKSSKT